MLTIQGALKKNGKRYFKYFNKNSKSHSVTGYLEEHPPTKYTICVAYLQYHNGYLSANYVLFNDWYHFRSILKQIYPSARTFCNVLTSKHRYFYMDIDFKTTSHTESIHSKERGIEITNKILTILFELHPKLMMKSAVHSFDDLVQNCWLFDSSRTDKLSYHIVNTMLKFDCLQSLRSTIGSIKETLCSTDNKWIQWSKSIDTRVYNAHQLLRQPGSVKAGQPMSMMKLIPIHPSQCKTKLIDQIRIHQCNADSIPNIFHSIKRTMAKNVSSYSIVDTRIDPNIAQIDKYYDKTHRCSCSASGILNTVSKYKSMQNTIVWTEMKCQNCYRLLSFEPNLVTNGRFSKYNPRIFSNLAGTYSTNI